MPTLSELVDEYDAICFVYTRKLDAYQTGGFVDQELYSLLATYMEVLKLVDKFIKNPPTFTGKVIGGPRRHRPLTKEDETRYLANLLNELRRSQVTVYDLLERLEHGSPIRKLDRTRLEETEKQLDTVFRACHNIYPP